mgnify:CR=1 FL=1
MNLINPNNAYFNLINSYNIGSINYSTHTNYDNNAQVKWFIFWWQSIPGFNNNIPYNNTTLTNWWDLFYNWDDTIRNNKTLWK